MTKATGQDHDMQLFIELMEKYGITYSVGGGYVWAGGHGLLDELIAKLIELGWDKDLHQVKEKFGGLRFYCGGLTTEQMAAIDEAEAKSYKICAIY